MARTGEDRGAEILGTLGRVVLPWCLLLVVARPLLMLRWPPAESVTLVFWLWVALSDLVVAVPFLMFAGGVILRDHLGYSSRAVRAAVVLGAAASILYYSLDAWAAPLVRHRDLINFGPETIDVRRFGARTPVGLLRNLRFVEANPPDEYSLSVDLPEQRPPDMVLWRLHFPVAVAMFTLVNVFLGVLAAELTFDLRRGRRRSARLATGVLGAVAFTAVLALTSFPAFTPEERVFPIDADLPSGILLAWIPLGLPLAELVLLVYLVRRRRY